jgi:hypothetical protein
MLEGVVSRLKAERLSLDQNPATLFDFYIKQVVTSPFAQENHVDVAMWLLQQATNPADPTDNASIAIVLSLLETFVVGDSSSICQELVSRGFLPKLKESVMGKHGKWASRPAIRLMYDICRLSRLSRDGLGVLSRSGTASAPAEALLYRPQHSPTKISSSIFLTSSKVRDI